MLVSLCLLCVYYLFVSFERHSLTTLSRTVVFVVDSSSTVACLSICVSFVVRCMFIYEADLRARWFTSLCWCCQLIGLCVGCVVVMFMLLLVVVGLLVCCCCFSVVKWTSGLVFEHMSECLYIMCFMC